MTRKSPEGPRFTRAGSSYFDTVQVYKYQWINSGFIALTGGSDWPIVPVTKRVYARMRACSRTTRALRLNIPKCISR